MAECCHGGKISVFSSLSNVQLGCKEEWIAAPHKDKSFAVWKHGNLNANVRCVLKYQTVFAVYKQCFVFGHFINNRAFKQHKLIERYIKSFVQYNFYSLYYIAYVSYSFNIVKIPVNLEFGVSLI
jgi:hypothetical protein